MANNHYRNLIFTNHALERLKDRKLSELTAWEAFNNPDASSPGKQPGTTEYKKHFGKSTVTVIATQNEKKDGWVVLSAWIDPPYPGTKDYREKEHYKAYQKAGFWGKVWLTLKSQLGF